MNPPIARWLRAALTVTLLAPVPASAQTFQGHVLDDENDAPIATALVTLIDREGVQVAISAADSSGAYRVEAPQPGVYKLLAERLGYDDFETPLLEAGSEDGVYPLDLLMAKSPLPIPGLSVVVDSEAMDRGIRQMLGMSTSSLRKQPIHYREIQSHIERGHDLAQLLRWQNVASMTVFRTAAGPCFTLRGSGCLEVYFNGMHYRQEILDVVPLDMIHAIVVLYPKESLVYPGGAILLYSEAWIR